MDQDQQRRTSSAKKETTQKKKMNIGVRKFTDKAAPKIEKDIRVDKIDSWNKLLPDSLGK